MKVYVSRLALSYGFETDRWRDGRFGFNVNQSVCWVQHTNQRGPQFVEPSLTKWRVKQDKVERVSVKVADSRKRVAFVDTHVACSQFGAQGTQGQDSLVVVFRHLDMGRATRGGFKSQGAAAREQVQNVLVREIASPKMLQPVVKGFADAIGRGTQAGALNDRDWCAPVFTAYNTDSVLFRHDDSGTIPGFNQPNFQVV